MWYNARMKFHLVLPARPFLVSLCAAAAMACHAVAPCRTLRPDPEALAERMARSEVHDASLPHVRAAVTKETLLDVVDVLVAYDLSAQRWLEANNKGSPAAFAQARIDKMNACLANSRIREFTFRLVGTVCMGADATQIRTSAGYVDLGRILTRHLVDEEGNVVATGEWARITDTREDLGADIVCVLVDAGLSGNVGLGYVLEDIAWERYSQDSSLISAFGDWAYNICSIGVVDDGYSMLHEIGHNMGCGHPDATCASPLEIDLGPQLYSYSSGYYFWIEDEGFFTVMGYNFGGLRPDGSYSPSDRFTEIPYFSSPQLTYRGVPIGTARNDNRRTLLNTYAHVAEYRVARLPRDAKPVDGGSSSLSHVFPTAFRPLKAVSGVAPYVGAVYNGEKVVGILSLKCGKVAKTGRAAGKSKVSAVVTGLDGKPKKAAPVYVSCGYDARANLAVKDKGKLTLTLGGEGFVGMLGNGLTVKTASVGGAWPHPRAVVDVDFDAGTGTLPSGTLADLLPTGEHAEPIGLSGGKWKFAAPAAVKYVKTTDKTTKKTSYQLTGLSDRKKTNLSAMKLVYKPKTGTFSGLFKVYVATTSGTRPRLKKLTAKVTGVVVGSVGYGRAEIKKVGTFPVSIHPEQ